MAVCSSWKRVIMFTPAFWTTYDFVPYRLIEKVDYWKVAVGYTELLDSNLFFDAAAYSSTGPDVVGDPRCSARQTIELATSFAPRSRNICIHAEDDFALPLILTRLVPVVAMRLESLTIARLSLSKRPQGTPEFSTPDSILSGFVPTLRVLRLSRCCLEWSNPGYFTWLTVLVLHDFRGSMAFDGMLLVNVLHILYLRFLSLRRVQCVWGDGRGVPSRFLLPRVEEMDVGLAGDRGLALLVASFDAPVKTLYVTLEVPEDATLLTLCPRLLSSVTTFVARGRVWDVLAAQEIFKYLHSAIAVDISRADRILFEGLLECGDLVLPTMRSLAVGGVSLDAIARYLQSRHWEKAPLEDVIVHTIPGTDLAGEAFDAGFIRWKVTRVVFDPVPWQEFDARWIGSLGALYE